MREKNAFRAQVEKTLWAGQSSLQTFLGTSLQGERASVSGIKSLVGPAVYRRLCNLKLELSVFVVVGSVFGKKVMNLYVQKSPWPGQASIQTKQRPSPAVRAGYVGNFHNVFVSFRDALRTSLTTEYCSIHKIKKTGR